MNYPVRSKYTMLIASLPPHKNSLFDEEQIPLSRIQLNKRLALLDKKDANDLLKIERLLHWSHIKNNIDQTFVNQTIESIDSLNNKFIKNIIIWRLELRIILAALRMRFQGQKNPPNKKISGFDYCYFKINKSWNEADFGLSKQLPWLTQANTLLLANKSYQLEKLLFGIVWDHYRQQSLGHYFDIEAVIIYVLRWDIIYRWTHNSNSKAVKRFNDLVDKELKNTQYGN